MRKPCIITYTTTWNHFENEYMKTKYVTRKLGRCHACELRFITYDMAESYIVWCVTLPHAESCAIPC